MIASLKYEQLPPFCNHCRIVGHSLGTCSAVAKQPETLEKGLHKQATHFKPHVPSTWVRKEGTVVEPPVVSKNDFEALATLENEEMATDNAKEEDTRHLETSLGEKERMDILGPSGALLDLKSRGMDSGSLPENAASDDNSSNTQMGVSTSKKGHNGKKVIRKEYSLRNKPVNGPTLHSPPHDTTFTITSTTDTRVLASMRIATNRSWADLCDEDDTPSKHEDAIPR